LHRDIKPDNMAMGIGKEAATLFLLDLGLGKQFMHGGIHNDKVTGKNLVGTARYASLNSHRGWGKCSVYI
jgi:serine/threonine protein kinase